jgi:hypothetical protein
MDLCAVAAAVPGMSGAAQADDGDSGFMCRFCIREVIRYA